MANAYLVPGGNGFINSSTNWSTTSGGVAGYTPVAGDDLIVDANSLNAPLTTISGPIYESLTFTNYTGTLTLTTGTITFRSGLEYASGMTVTGTGAVTVGGTGMSTAFVNFNGVTHSGNFNFSNGAQLQTTYTITGDLNIIGNVLFGNSNLGGQGVKIIVNGGRILCNSGFSIFGNGNRFLQGSTEIWFIGTGTGTYAAGTTTRMVGMSVYFAKTGGSLTMTSGAMYPNNTTLTYISGTFNGFILACGTNNTYLDTAGMTWASASVTGSGVLTNHSQLNIAGTFSIGLNNILLGAGQINCANLTNTTSFGILTGKTINVSSTLTSVGTAASPFIIYSSLYGTKANLILSNSGNQDVAHTNGRDIDSDGGTTIYSYRAASITNCDNWATLPIITSINTNSILR